MDDLARFAEQYHALVASDNEFQRRARVLQSIWREEQGYPIGCHEGKQGPVALGSRLAMPWAEETLANYLTGNIRQVVRQEVLDPIRSEGKLYGRPRIFDDLLSSQPLCFNLFGELRYKLPLASIVFEDLTAGRVRQVTYIEFEYSPGRGDRRFTGDHSAFDVYLEFITTDGKPGFPGIEVKYHENLRNKAATHRPRYDELADMMGCFRPGHPKQLRNTPLQQIWRDHLLTGSMQHLSEFDDGFFALLYPKDNAACSQAALSYSNCLSSTRTFVAWILESVAQAIKRHSDADWIDRLIDRYLDFGKLDRLSEPRQAIHCIPP